MYRRTGFCSILLACALARTAAAQTLPAGATIEVRLKENLSSDTVRAGDPVEAVFAGTLRWQGAVIVPAGSRYLGKVEHVQKQTDSEGAWIRLLFFEIESPDGTRIAADASNSFRTSKPRGILEYAVAVPLGAAGGAALGGRSARVAGLLGGALAGFILATNYHASYAAIHLHAGQKVALHLSSEIRAAGASPR